MLNRRIRWLGALLGLFALASTAFTVDAPAPSRVVVPAVDTAQWPPVWFFDSAIGAKLKRDAVSLWRFEDSTNLGLDTQGANNLTNNATVTQAAGKVGQAASFASASSQFFSIADNASLSMPGTSFTITAWINFATTGTRTIAGKWQSSNFEYIIYLSTSHIEMIVNHLGAGGDTAAVSGVTLSTGTWYFVRGWLDVNAGTVNILINEANLATVAHTTGTVDGAATFRIGADSSPAADFWNGQLDEVGIWKRVLTTSEANWLYNSGTGRLLAQSPQQFLLRGLVERLKRAA